MKNKLNKGHYLELMDRLHVLMSTLHDHIIEHPVSKQNKEFKKQLTKSLDLLWETYQKVGVIHFLTEKEYETISKVIPRRRKKSKNRRLDNRS